MYTDSACTSPEICHSHCNEVNNASFLSGPEHPENQNAETIYNDFEGIIPFN